MNEIATLYEFSGAHSHAFLPCESVEDMQAKAREHAKKVNDYVHVSDMKGNWLFSVNGRASNL